MTTARELVEEVQPCLPLPAIRDVAEISGVDGIVCLAEHSDGRGGLVFISHSIEVAEQRIIGAIWQACAERGWTFGLCWGGPLYKPSGMHVSINTDDMSEDAKAFTAEGTDALAFCKAFAAAREAE